MDESHPIYRAIDKGGGQTCDIVGVIRELLAAGYVIVPHDISNEACDIALRATGSWLKIEGSGLSVNREKMRRRWLACSMQGASGGVRRAIREATGGSIRRNEQRKLGALKLLTARSTKGARGFTVGISPPPASALWNTR